MLDRAHIAAIKRKFGTVDDTTEDETYSEAEDELMQLRQKAERLERSNRALRQALVRDAQPIEPKRDATIKSVAELSRDYPGAAEVFREHGPGEPAYLPAALPASERRRIEQHAAKVERARATKDPAAVLDALDVDAPLRGDLTAARDSSQRVLPPGENWPRSPPPRPDDYSHMMRRQTAAEAELALAEAKSAEARVALDTRSLSAGAFALYRKRRGLE